MNCFPKWPNGKSHCTLLCYQHQIPNIFDPTQVIGVRWVVDLQQEAVNLKLQLFRYQLFLAAIINDKKNQAIFYLTVPCDKCFFQNGWIVFGHIINCGFGASGLLIVISASYCCSRRKVVSWGCCSVRRALNSALDLRDLHLLLECMSIF